MPPTLCALVAEVSLFILVWRVSIEVDESVGLVLTISQGRSTKKPYPHDLNRCISWPFAEKDPRSSADSRIYDEGRQTANALGGAFFQVMDGLVGGMSFALGYRSRRR